MAQRRSGLFDFVRRRTPQVPYLPTPVQHRRAKPSLSHRPSLDTLIRAQSATLTGTEAVDTGLSPHRQKRIKTSHDSGSLQNDVYMSVESPPTPEAPAAASRLHTLDPQLDHGVRSPIGRRKTLPKGWAIVTEQAEPTPPQAASNRGLLTEPPSSPSHQAQWVAERIKRLSSTRSEPKPRQPSLDESPQHTAIALHGSEESESMTHRGRSSGRHRRQTSKAKDAYIVNLLPMPRGDERERNLQLRSDHAGHDMLAALLVDDNVRRTLGSHSKSDHGLAIERQRCGDLFLASLAGLCNPDDTKPAARLKRALEKSRNDAAFVSALQVLAYCPQVIQAIDATFLDVPDEASSSMGTQPGQVSCWNEVVHGSGTGQTTSLGPPDMPAINGEHMPSNISTTKPLPLARPRSDVQTQFFESDSRRLYTAATTYAYAPAAAIPPNEDSVDSDAAPDYGEDVIGLSDDELQYEADQHSSSDDAAENKLFVPRDYTPIDAEQSKMESAAVHKAVATLDEMAFGPPIFAVPQSSGVFSNPFLNPLIAPPVPKTYASPYGNPQPASKSAAEVGSTPSHPASVPDEIEKPAPSTEPDHATTPVVISGTSENRPHTHVKNGHAGPEMAPSAQGHDLGNVTSRGEENLGRIMASTSNEMVHTVNGDARTTDVADKAHKLNGRSEAKVKSKDDAISSAVEADKVVMKTTEPKSSMDQIDFLLALASGGNLGENDSDSDSDGTDHDRTISRSPTPTPVPPPSPGDVELETIIQGIIHELNTGQNWGHGIGFLDPQTFSWQLNNAPRFATELRRSVDDAHLGVNKVIPAEQSCLIERFYETLVKRITNPWVGGAPMPQFSTVVFHNGQAYQAIPGPAHPMYQGPAVPPPPPPPPTQMLMSQVKTPNRIEPRYNLAQGKADTGRRSAKSMAKSTAPAGAPAGPAASLERPLQPAQALPVRLPRQREKKPSKRSIGKRKTAAVKVRSGTLSDQSSDFEVDHRRKRKATR